MTERFLTRMSLGVPILDTITKPCRIEPISTNVFRLFLTQGLNRQIRRMCEYFDYDVVALKRIRIINITLDIPVGSYRELTKEELQELNKLIEPSSKTQEASENNLDLNQLDLGESKAVVSSVRGSKKNFERETNKTVDNRTFSLRNERLTKRRR